MTATVDAGSGADPAGGSPEGPPDRRRRSDARRASWLIAPALAILGLVIGYPVVRALMLSFQADRGLDPETGMFSEGGFAGAANYTHWLLQDCGGGAFSCPPGTLGADFWDSVWVTLFFTVVTVSIEIALGLWMATLMSKNVWGRSLIRASVLIPWAIPTAVTAKLWFFIFAENGIVNSLLGQPIAWTTDPWASRVAVIVADVWKTTPFMALLILAGIQMIPGDLYEAARLDGATRWQRFRYVTLPLLKPALMVAILFRTLDALRMFDLPAILSGTGGASPTTTISILVVADMRQGHFNSASALSTLVFLLVFAVAYLLVKVLGANVVRTQRAQREGRVEA